MAIVINGSGTVTGISVGGLPDGVVDAGTLADNAVGLAQMAGGTDGNVITYDTSGNPAVVATGSDGQVLTSAGADAVPAFEAVAAGGKVLQVVQTVKVDTFSHNSASWADITGLTVNITPSSSSNKILVSYVTNLSGSTTGGHTCLLRCLRDSTAIGVGTGASNRKPASGLHFNHNTAASNWFSFEHLDSPSTTSAITYKVQLYPENGQTAYVNRSAQDGDYTYHGRFASSITVKEIAG